MFGKLLLLLWALSLLREPTSTTSRTSSLNIIIIRILKVLRTGVGEQTVHLQKEVRVDEEVLEHRVTTTTATAAGATAVVGLICRRTISTGLNGRQPLGIVRRELLRLDAPRKVAPIVGDHV